MAARSSYLARPIQPDDADDILLWRLVIELLTQPSPRQRLPEVTTLEDVVHLIQSSSNIIVLSGAGVSWCPALRQH